MNKTVDKISEHLSISKTDINLIMDLVMQYYPCSYSEIQNRLFLIFSSSITPEHYFCLGLIYSDIDSYIKYQKQLNQICSIKLN